MNDELTLSFLLGAFALAVLLTCRCLLHLALGTERTRRWAVWVFSAAGTSVAVILAADAIGRVAGRDSSPLALLAALPFCALAIVSLPLHNWAGSLHLPVRRLLAHPAPWLLLGWSLCACVWSGSRLGQIVFPTPDELATSPRPELEVDSQASAISDRGRAIPLFRMHADVPGWPGGFQGTTAALKRMMQTVICRAGPDAGANCHGWVFAGGRYLLDGNGVQTILDDNGYEPCSEPQTGDLVVYWSGEFIAHTGVVSGVLADGTVLVESKWNLQERFLHRPEDQPYSREFTYYRTARGSHDITILDGRTAAK